MLNDEQCNELLDLTHTVASYGARSGIDALLAYINTLLAAEREAAVEECAALCGDADKNTHPADLAAAIRALKGVGNG